MATHEGRVILRVSTKLKKHTRLPPTPPSPPVQTPIARQLSGDKHEVEMAMRLVEMTQRRRDAWQWQDDESESDSGDDYDEKRRKERISKGFGVECQTFYSDTDQEDGFYSNSLHMAGG